MVGWITISGTLFRHRDRKTDKQKDRDAGRQADRQTERKDKQGDRNIETQTTIQEGKETERRRHTYSKVLPSVILFCKFNKYPRIE